eukprot:3757671-Prymnesium_polylepis.1
MIYGAVVAAAVIGFQAPPTGMRARRSAVRLAAVDQEAMVTLDELPDEPKPELEWSVSQTVHAVCLALQHNDHPEQDAGMKRLYHYLHPRGRVDIAPPPPSAGLQGFVTLEDFMSNAGSPALGSLLLCSDFKLIGEPTISPGGQARGSFATQMIEVFNEPASADDDDDDDNDDEVARTLQGLIS